MNHVWGIISAICLTMTSFAIYAAAWSLAATLALMTIVTALWQIAAILGEKK